MYRRLNNGHQSDHSMDKSICLQRNPQKTGREFSTSREKEWNQQYQTDVSSTLRSLQKIIHVDKITSTGASNE
jgi:hypothetical protein